MLPLNPNQHCHLQAESSFAGHLCYCYNTIWAPSIYKLSSYDFIRWENLMPFLFQSIRIPTSLVTSIAFELYNPNDSMKKGRQGIQKPSPSCYHLRETSWLPLACLSRFRFPEKVIQKVRNCHFLWTSFSGLLFLLKFLPDESSKPRYNM